MNISSLFIYTSPLAFIFLAFSTKSAHRDLCVICAALLLFLILALRIDLGFDYSNYVDILNSSTACYHGITACAISDIARSLNSSILFFAIYALLTISCILYVTLSEKSPVILLNFMCLPWFYIESFTIIRQELSIAFAVVAYFYFQKSNKLVQLLFFSCLSVSTHISSLPFVMLLFGLRYFGKHMILRKMVLVFILGLSALVHLVFDLLLEFYPLLQFYSNGTSFGLSLFGLAVLLFLFSYRSISSKDSNYILLVGLFAYAGTLVIDSSLARLAIPFLIPLLWYKWDIIFNIIYLKKLQVYFAVIACIFLFTIMMKVKSGDENSSLIPYTSFINLL